MKKKRKMGNTNSILFLRIDSILFKKRKANIYTYDFENFYLSFNLLFQETVSSKSREGISVFLYICSTQEMFSFYFIF